MQGEPATGRAMPIETSATPEGIKPPAFVFYVAVKKNRVKGLP